MNYLTDLVYKITELKTQIDLNVRYRDANLFVCCALAKERHNDPNLAYSSIDDNSYTR